MPANVRANAARRLLAMLALGGALVACDTSPGPTPPSLTPPAAATASPEPAELAALRARPLRLPTLTAGNACPVTQPAPPDPPPPSGHPLSTGGAASALGHAPVFPDARYNRGNLLRVTPDATRPGWYEAKVPWASRTGYLGWTLIRGARLDGPGHVRVELQLADSSMVGGDAVAVEVQADWQFWPGSTEVTSAGCYAYQVDGGGFTEVIVFRAEVGGS
jgi:hypothetical protein